jgi:hypothetical protein
MSKEERSRSLASKAGGGRPLGELQVPVSGPVENHKYPLPSFEPDMIDNLTQLISCNLVSMVGGSFRMELRRGLVYPCHTMLDDV